MSSTEYSTNQNFSLEVIKTLGQSGADVCTLFSKVGTTAVSNIGSIGTSLFSSVDNVINSYKETKLKKLEKDFKIIENSHAERMQEINNAHDLAMAKEQKEILIEQNRHEEYMFSEKRKIFEKLIDSANAAFNARMEFFKMQLNCLEETYNKQIDLISEDIRFLENERSKYMGDIDKYMSLSSELSKLEENKSALYKEYVIAQGSLSDAVKYLKIEQKYSPLLEQDENKLLD